MEINNKTAPVTGQQDQNTISLDLMSRMKLHGMAERLCQNTNAFLKINKPKLLNKKNDSDTGVNHRFSRKTLRYGVQLIKDGKKRLS